MMLADAFFSKTKGIDSGIVYGIIGSCDFFHANDQVTLAIAGAVKLVGQLQHCFVTPLAHIGNDVPHGLSDIFRYFAF
jgi:hypothetical protein